MQTYQNVYIKCVHFLCQLFLSKVFKQRNEDITTHDCLYNALKLPDYSKLDRIGIFMQVLYNWKFAKNATHCMNR